MCSPRSPLLTVFAMAMVLVVQASAFLADQDVGQCSENTTPCSIEVTAPESVVGKYQSRYSWFGAHPTEALAPAPAVVADPYNACGLGPLDNVDATKDHIVFAGEGGIFSGSLDCLANYKTAVVQRSGGAGIIIVRSKNGPLPSSSMRFPSTDGLTIPTVSLRMETFDFFVANASLSDLRISFLPPNDADLLDRAPKYMAAWRAKTLTFGTLFLLVFLVGLTGAIGVFAKSKKITNVSFLVLIIVTLVSLCKVLTLYNTWDGAALWGEFGDTLFLILQVLGAFALFSILLFFWARVHMNSGIPGSASTIFLRRFEIGLIVFNCLVSIFFLLFLAVVGGQVAFGTPTTEDHQLARDMFYAINTVLLFITVVMELSMLYMGIKVFIQLYKVLKLNALKQQFEKKRVVLLKKVSIFLSILTLTQLWWIISKLLVVLVPGFRWASKSTPPYNDLYWEGIVDNVCHFSIFLLSALTFHPGLPDRVKTRFNRSATVTTTGSSISASGMGTHSHANGEGRSDDMSDEVSVSVDEEGGTRV